MTKTTNGIIATATILVIVAAVASRKFIISVSLYSIQND